jgi:hypothetical protein
MKFVSTLFIVFVILPVAHQPTFPLASPYITFNPGAEIRATLFENQLYFQHEKEHKPHPEYEWVVV